MIHDAPFRIAALATIIALAVIRSPYAIGAWNARSRVETRSKDRLDLALLIAFGPLAVLSPVVFAVVPDALYWAEVALPPAARWPGLGLVLGALALFIWTHRALGRNWSVSVVLRHDHRLVTNGPYRWARHPMYAAIFGLSLALSLLTANALVAMGWIGLCVLVVRRVPAEEAALTRRFGEEYRAYMERTGRYFAKL